jgi:hypothetical protein
MIDAATLRGFERRSEGVPDGSVLEPGAPNRDRGTATADPPPQEEALTLATAGAAHRLIGGRVDWVAGVALAPAPLKPNASYARIPGSRLRSWRSA